MVSLIKALKHNPYWLTPLILGTLSLALIIIGAFQGFVVVDKYLMLLVACLLTNLIPSPLKNGNNGNNGVLKPLKPIKKRRKSKRSKKKGRK